eukprot:1177307-Prorocentrum_minimum.AAC.2
MVAPFTIVAAAPVVRVLALALLLAPAVAIVVLVAALAVLLLLFGHFPLALRPLPLKGVERLLLRRLEHGLHHGLRGRHLIGFAREHSRNIPAISQRERLRATPTAPAPKRPPRRRRTDHGVRQGTEP